jgi:hypothetical protein
MKKTGHIVQIDDFIQISVELTGFSEIELLATGMLGDYYGLIVDNRDEIDLTAFFDEVKMILAIGRYDPGVANKLIGENLIPDSQYGGLAKKIILMWYSGLKPVAVGPQIASDAAYIHSFMWKVAKTHPSGAMQPGYGSWEEKPIGR